MNEQMENGHRSYNSLLLSTYIKDFKKEKKAYLSSVTFQTSI